MRVTLLFHFLSFAFAAPESSSSSLSISPNDHSDPTSSTTSSSAKALPSSARNIGRSILNDLGATATTSSIDSSSTQTAVSGVTAASALPSLIVTVPLPTTLKANSTVPSATPTITGSVNYVNPWEGHFSGIVPTTGTGSDYALQCQNAYFLYTSIKQGFIDGTSSLFDLTQVIRSTTSYKIQTYFNTSYYSLCDGVPRVITSEPTATSTTTYDPSTRTLLAFGIGWATMAWPECKVAWNDCQTLWSRYYSASSEYDEITYGTASTVVSLGEGASSWVVDGVTTTFAAPYPETISLGTEAIHTELPGNKVYIIVTTPPPGGIFLDDGYRMTAGGPPVTIEHVQDFINTPYTPECRTEKPTCTANQRCVIGGDKVEIFYFPPQTNATRDMCATAPAENGITSRPPTNFTWTPITTGPYTVLPGNTTWYSGNVYVSLNRINAQCVWSGTSLEVGQHHGGEILTMAPSELFSERAIRITTSGPHSGMLEFEPHAYSFNFADLESPYPWSAWKGTPDCVREGCSSINGSYNPWIAVPEAIRRLDARWATCDLALDGLYDPPRRLTSVGNIFATTTTRNPKPEATPGQQPPNSVVEPTRVAPPPPPPPPPANNPPNNDPPNNRPPNNDPPNLDPPSPANPNSNPKPKPPTQPRPPPPPPPSPITTLGTHTIFPNPRTPGLLIDHTLPLLPDGPAITLSDNTILSLHSSSLLVSFPGQSTASTLLLPSFPSPLPGYERTGAGWTIGGGGGGVVTIGGFVYTVGRPGGVVVVPWLGITITLTGGGSGGTGYGTDGMGSGTRTGTGTGTGTGTEGVSFSSATGTSTTATVGGKETETGVVTGTAARSGELGWWLWIWMGVWTAVGGLNMQT